MFDGVLKDGSRVLVVVFEEVLELNSVRLGGVEGVDVDLVFRERNFFVVLNYELDWAKLPPLLLSPVVVNCEGLLVTNL